MKKIFFNFIIVFIMVFIGCEKQTEIFNLSSGYEDYALVIPQGNPYEYVGINHNLLVDSMVTQFIDSYGTNMELYDFDQYPIESSQTVSLIFNYWVQASQVTGINPTMSYSDALNETVSIYGGLNEYSIPLTSSVAYSQHIANFNNSLSAADKIYADSLGDIMFGAIQKLINEEDEETVFFDLKEELNLFEQSMLLDNDVSINPQNYTSLKLVATARHSLNYWYEASGLNFISQPLSKKSDVIQGMSQKGKDVAAVLWTGCADIWGTPAASLAVGVWCVFAREEGGVMDTLTDAIAGWFD